MEEGLVFLALLGLIGLAIYIYILVWIHKDASKRGMNAALWTVLAFFFPLLGLLLYLIFRTSEKTRICPVCGKQLLPSWDKCPYHLEPQAERRPPVERIAPQATERGGTERMEERPHVDRPKRVETVRLEDVSKPMQWASFVITEGKRPGLTYQLKEESTTIGREGNVGNDIVIDDETMSGRHAKVKIEEGKFILYDLASENGTKVNGVLITKQEIIDGDVIEMGRTKMVFKRV